MLGYLWSLIKPASIFAITYFIFVDLFKINDGTKVYGMELLLGIVVWTFFAECTASSMQAIASNGGLIRKAYFPRSILVIAASLSSLFTFVINLLIVFVIAVALRDIDLGLRIVMVIPLLLELYALALGISLFLSALFVQFHDVSHLWEVLINLLFYASGVMFSLTYVLQRLHLAVEVGATTRPAPRPGLDHAGHGRQSHHPDHRGPAPRGGHAGGALDRAGGERPPRRRQAVRSGQRRLGGAGAVPDRDPGGDLRSAHLPVACAELRTEPVTVTDRDLAIRVENLSKRFRIPLDRSSTLKHRLTHCATPPATAAWRRSGTSASRCARVSSSGSSAHNGSGKSTLLKILSRIYRPDAGVVTINGRVSPFLELGVGFNPELTARENIFLSGAILGLGRPSCTGVSTTSSASPSWSSSSTTSSRTSPRGWRCASRSPWPSRPTPRS